MCESLLAEDANVICLDNFFTGTQRNVEHLLTPNASRSSGRSLLFDRETAIAR
jgi:hypothetical protein